MLQKNAITEVPPNSPGFYSWRVASSNRFKKSERSHLGTSLSYVHYKLSSEYHAKRRSDSVVPHLDDCLVHHPGQRVLLRTSSGPALRNAEPGRFCSKRKKIRAGQYIHFHGIRLRLDLGIFSLAPRVQSSGDSNMCVQAILPSSPVLSSGPTHGLTQLGLRSYPSGSFVPETVTTLFLFIGPDRPVYTTALVRPLGPCQPTSAVAGSVFSYLWNPYPSVSGGIYDIHGCLHSGVGRPHGEFPNFGYLGPSGPPAPHQLLGTQGGRS